MSGVKDRGKLEGISRRMSELDYDERWLIRYNTAPRVNDQLPRAHLCILYRRRCLTTRTEAGALEWGPPVCEALKYGSI